MAIATLSIDLEARLARLEQDMSRATATVDRAAKRMEGAFAGLRGAATKALAGFSAGAAVITLGHMVSAIVQGIDKLNDLSDATGASVENISALEDVAARTGTNIDTVGQALVKMNQQLAEAQKPGSEAALVFERLGLNVKELQALDPADALVRVAQALARFADDGDKARYVQALFGKSVREVAPLLKDLAEAGKLNATVTKEQAEQAEKFAQMLTGIQKSLADVARAGLLPIITAMNGFIDRLREGQKEGRGFLSVMLDTQLAFLGFGKGKREGGASGDFGDDPRDALRRMEASYKPGLGGLPTAPKKTGGGGADRLSDAERYLENLQRQVETALEMSSVEKVLYDLNNGKLQLSKGVTQEMLLEAASIADRLKEEAKWQDELNKRVREAADLRSKEYDAAVAAANANIEADRSRLRGILERTPSGVFEQQQRDVDFLQRKLEQGAITLEQYGESVRVVFGIAQEEAKKTKSITEELGLTMSSAFEDAIVNGGKLSDILKALEKDILRIVMRKLVTEPLGNAITGMLGGSGGGGGDLFGKVGGWIAGLFSGKFADGGYIPPGRWGMTGERGPEAVFGGRSGATVRPIGGNITINVAVPGNTDSRTAQQVAVAAARAVAVAQRRGA